MDTAPLRRLFRSSFGSEPESVAPLKGDGSARRLWRLAGAGKTAIGVLGPDPQENRAFLGFSRHFRGHGLPVPEIYGEDAEAGAYLEGDLGEETLFELLTRTRSGPALSAEAASVYRKAVRWLPRFQVAAGRDLDYGLCYPRGSFDRQSMLWDLNHFKYYFLRLARIPFHEQTLEDDFGRFADFLLEAERDHFLYRDFQSRNVVVRDGEPGFVDYQGGRRGALPYDIASLLYDAKADLPVETRDELLAAYLDAAAEVAPLDRGRFLRFYPGFVYIRIMQALGTYGLRGFYERKAPFLQSIPYAVRNLEHLLGTCELPLRLPALSEVWRRLVASSALRQYGRVSLCLTVRVQSFSFRNGVPTDERGHGGGYVFDCRALPNPGREARFADLPGTDPAVTAFLAREAAVRSFLDHVFALVDAAVENYRSRNFTDLQVAFGCTGGRHRSVYCAERLAERLRARPELRVELTHLALE